MAKRQHPSGRTTSMGTNTREASMYDMDWRKHGQLSMAYATNESTARRVHPEIRTTTQIGRDLRLGLNTCASGNDLRSADSASPVHARRLQGDG